MSFDSLILHHVTHEIRETLIGGIIRHVQQLSTLDIAIKVSHMNHVNYLLMSADPLRARAHLMERPSKGEERLHFSDFLMTHIGRGTIIKVEQIGWDRVLKITIEPHSEHPVQSPARAIIGEFMGKHSNIVLINEGTGKILESIKHIDDTMSRHRQIIPGIRYVLPPRPQKHDPLTLDRESFFSILEREPVVNWRLLFSQIDGLSPTLAKEIVCRTAESATSQQCWDRFQSVIAYFDTTRCLPQVYVDPDDHANVLAVSSLPLLQLSDNRSQRFERISEAVECYYSMIAIKEAIQSERHALRQGLERLMDTVVRKIGRLRSDLANADQAESYRIKGELLTANLQRVQRGALSIEVQNYYTSHLRPIKIELDPELRPSENAQLYFKKYTKAKRGRSVINQLISENESDQQILRNFISELEVAGTVEQLHAIREECVKIGWIKDDKKRQRKRSVSGGEFQKYTSSDGFQLYVGRNSKENDLLLRRIASGRDMWLHTKQIHGSHVVIRNPENKPDIPMQTLLYAAQIAAYFSKGKHASHVPVDYTWVRYVIKPKGAAPGYVHYTHEKTLYVEPLRPTKDA